MHFFAFVAAALLPYAASDAGASPGGADCPETSAYGYSCPSMGALFAASAGGGPERCATLESWGVDCTGCDCENVIDLEAYELPDDYACAATEWNGMTCDEMAYLGFNCHYMETRRGADCSGCLCEEIVLDYEKGDGSCPHSCGGQNCDVAAAVHGVSCEFLESSSSFTACDCSGCACDTYDDESLQVSYGSTDCNGNVFTYAIGSIGDETCEDDLTAWTMGASVYNEALTWFGCLNCPELECDGGDCGDSCDRGETCALPLDELCADEDSIISPTQWGRAFYCTEEALAALAARTDAPTEAATEATVAADEEDGSFALTTTAVLAVALLWA